jgi:hypothetical protein
MPYIITGDDPKIPVEISDKDGVIAIAGTATIKAAVVSSNRKTVILPAVSVIEATAGSDWTKGIVVVNFLSAATSVIPKSHLGSALLEIQIDDNGKQTWFDEIEIIKGTIDQ